MRWNNIVGASLRERIESRCRSRIYVWDNDHVDDEYLGL